MADFLTRQTLLVLGGGDAAGWVWCTPLTGQPGFLRVLDPTTVTIAAAPHPQDPLAAVPTTAPTRVGALTLDPLRRRRMRLTGRHHPEYWW